MQNLISVFNTRELAILTLAAAGVIVALFFKQPRSLLWDFLKLAFSLLKIRLYLVMLVYVAAWLFLFYRLGVWEPGLLKDTIKWLLFAATVTFFHLDKFREDSREYLKVFKEVFTGSVLLEFFTDKFTFSYWVELLLLPSVTLIALLRLITEKDKSLRPADKLFQYFLMLAGVLFLGHVIFHGVEEFHSWFTVESLKEFLLPVVLSIVLMPYIFALSAYMVYQVQYRALEKKLADSSVLPYARRKALRSFLWHYKDMRRWVLRLKFEEIGTRAELDDSIASLRMTQQNERTDIVADPTDGWSPYEAIRFLEPVFKTGFYDPRFEDKWMADSRSVYIGDDWHSNYFRYEVLGLELVAHSLELQLNLMTPAEKGQAYDLLGSYAIELFNKSTGSAMPDRYVKKLFEGKSFHFNHGDTRVSLQRNDWPNTVYHSYDLVFTLQRGNTQGYD